MAETKSVFETLNSVNCSEYIEQKNGLNYLSWSYAWQELLKNYPDSTYKIYENENGMFYFTDGKTCWVKTGVTVQGKEYIEYLPVMDFRNKSISVESVTSVDVNKTIQRSLTKAIARHGLGLYIYAGEDLPQSVEEANKAEAEELNKLLNDVSKILNDKNNCFTEKQTNYALWCIEHKNKEGLEKIVSSVVGKEIA